MIGHVVAPWGVLFQGEDSQILGQISPSELQSSAKKSMEGLLWWITHWNLRIFPGFSWTPPFCCKGKITLTTYDLPPLWVKVRLLAGTNCTYFHWSLLWINRKIPGTLFGCESPTDDPSSEWIQSCISRQKGIEHFKNELWAFKGLHLSSLSKTSTFHLFFVCFGN